jgi:hypothetical protein
MAQRSVVRWKSLAMNVSIQKCDSSCEKSTSENTISILLRAAAITFAILLLAAFWVPIDVSMSGATYYSADLFTHLAPRALLGTIGKSLHIKWTGFILLRQLFQALWLFLIVLQLTKSLRSKESSSFILEISALSFLFGFNTVVFTTNGESRFIDVVPYALVLCAVFVLLATDGRATITRRVAVTLLLLSAVMVHEKSVFDIAILAVWTTWKYGFKRSASLMLPSILGSLCFLWLVSNRATLGLSPLESIKLLRSGLTFLGRESFSIWGIILAGGMLWVIFVVVAHHFLKTTVNYSMQGCIAVIMMTLLCFAPLLVAHDTIRIVGVIWLPTFLLICEIDLKSALQSVRFRQWALGACFLQLLLPPVLLYLGGVAPLNCYSELILRFLPPEKDFTPVATSHDGLAPAVGPFGLYALDRRDISDAIVCWPPRPIRFAAQSGSQ